MKQYISLLQEILEDGVHKEPSRPGLPETLSVFGTRMQFDLTKEFPILTTKKMYWKGIVTELLWMLKGDTNIKYLVDNGCNVWNKDAYRWYLSKRRQFYKGHNISPPERSFEDFVSFIKEHTFEYLKHWLPEYSLGDLGKIYGYQWRNQNGVDQIAELIQSLKTAPNSRYHIFDAWNKADFKEMALPPCHLLYQFNTRKMTDMQRLAYVPEEACVNGNLAQILDTYKPPMYYLDMQMYQRSCDSVLGVPFDITHNGVLMHIIAKATNMIPGMYTWVGGDTHIYANHHEAVHEQLHRTPRKSPKLNVYASITSIEDIELLRPDQFELTDYDPYPAIKAELSVGT